MEHSKASTHIIEQVYRARESLGIALGQTQDIGNIDLDVDSISRSLARSVKSLYQAEAEGLLDSRLVGEAMDHLRDILQSMQDVTVSDSGLDAAIATVAKVLAILYPVYKALPEAGVCQIVRESVLPSPSRLESGQYDFDERREYPRMAIEAHIGFQSETNFYTGFSMDISSGGLFVATYNVPSLGTKVNLNFKLPSGPLMSLDGEVRWIREYNEITPDITPGIGVKFEALSPEETDQINAYINTTTPLFYEH